MENLEDKTCPFFDNCSLNVQDVAYTCYGDYEECPYYVKYKNDYEKWEGEE